MARQGKWFGITPEAIEAAKVASLNSMVAKIVPLRVVAAPSELDSHSESV
jgi:hypothetical protein